MDSMVIYEIMEELGSVITTGQVIYYVSMYLLGIAAYVLTAISLYSIAKRRGIAHPWMAWVPVVNVWVLGSISDQFRYVTKAQVKNKRTTLLVLQIINAVVSTVMIVVMLVGVFNFFEVAMNGGEEEIMMQGMSLMLKCLGSCLVGLGISVAYCIVYFIALYDVFMSVNPDNAVLFLVLGIVVGITTPFFLFFNRKKDGGMPPRCDVPQPPVNAVPEAPVQEAEPVMIEAPAEEPPVEETPAEEPATEETEAPAEESTEQTEA